GLFGLGQRHVENAVPVRRLDFLTIDAGGHRYGAEELLMAPFVIAAFLFLAFASVGGAEHELVVAHLDVKIVGFESRSLRSNCDGGIVLLHVEAPAVAWPDLAVAGEVP